MPRCHFVAGRGVLKQSESWPLGFKPEPALVHTIMGLISRSPVGAPLLFRAYNHLLKHFKDEYAARTYYGATLTCNLDDLISRTIFYFGFWEPNNSALMAKILKPGDVFVDVGANIGYYTLLASRLVGSTGKVVAVEAAPVIYGRLQANVQANKADNVRLLNVAVSDSVGELDIYGGTKWNRGATSTLSQDGQVPEARVAAAPLDTLLTEDELKRVALIKIDVEGAESRVLRRLLGTLHLYSPGMRILVELAPQICGKDLEPVFDALLAAGFDAFAIENEYDMDWYMRWRVPGILQKIDRLPSRQVDALLERRA